MSNQFNFLLVGILSCFSSGAWGQITIHVDDFPPVGFQGEYYHQDSAAFSVGVSGANQVWNFGSYDWDVVLPITRVTPESTPYGYLFPEANMAIGFGEMFIYLQALPVGLYRIGVASATDTALYSQNPVDPILPLAYQSNWTTVARWADYAPGWERMDSMINVVDGWGTLQTPYFSGPVLREYTHRWSTFGQVGQPPQWSDEDIGYRWLAQWGFNAAEVWSRDGVLDPNFSEGELGMTGIVTEIVPPRGPVASSFHVGQNYPNPFNPETRIPFELTRSGLVELKIYDELGRLVYSLEEEHTAGSHEFLVPGAAWPSGTYFAHMKTLIEEHTLRMCLVK